MASSPRLEGYGVVRVTILSNGSTLNETVKLISVSINRAINKIPVATVVLLDGDMPRGDFPLSNERSFAPGSEIEIRAGYDQDEQTIFKGVIVRHGIEISGNNESRLVVECRDKAVAMTIGRHNQNYVDSKDGDIISGLIRSYAGLSSDVEATRVQHKELVQHYCTDWDFVLSRAEVNGLLVIVEDGEVGVGAPRTDASPVLSVTYGEDLMEFKADIDARTQLAKVRVATWNPQEQAVAEEVVGPQGLNDQGNLDSGELAKVVGLEEFRLQTAVPMEKEAMTAWAQARELKAGLARIRGSMRFQGSARAKPGSLIEVLGVGDRFAGDVFVSAVRHEIGEGDWITEVDFGMAPEWFAEQHELVAPPASGLVPGVEGLQIGVVMKLDQDPEGQHRVQVGVPVFQAETEGVWARLATYYASDTIGAFFVPEIGDEVVLGYLNNDPAHPVILGGLYSSKRPPPYEMTEENYTKALVTRSELKMEFDDEKKVITIITPGENRIILSDDDKSILLEDQNNNKVTLGPDGITLDSPKDIAITAEGKVSIDAVGEISVKSDADVKLEGLNINNKANVGFKAEGSASAELSASGQTTVKGAMVMIN